MFDLELVEKVAYPDAHEIAVVNRDVKLLEIIKDADLSLGPIRLLKVKFLVRSAVNGEVLEAIYRRRNELRGWPTLFICRGSCLLLCSYLDLFKHQNLDPDVHVKRIACGLVRSTYRFGKSSAEVER